MLKNLSLTNNKRRVIFVVLATAVIFTVMLTRQQKSLEPTVETKASTSNKAPDFAAITDVNEKKQVFFDYLKPSIQHENQRISLERSRLEKIQTSFIQGSISADNKQYVDQLSKLYSVTIPEKGINEQWFTEILSKVNVLPEALVMTQAANESAWGTSRFATEANNYFGQWCYKVGCGLVPLKRAEGAKHEVAKFNSVTESVHAYFMNVNRNPAYSDLRNIRIKLASQGSNLTSVKTANSLTNGLLSYSERGQDYVNDLQSMLRVNNKYWTLK